MNFEFEKLACQQLSRCRWKESTLNAKEGIMVVKRLRMPELIGLSKSGACFILF